MYEKYLLNSDSDEEIGWSRSKDLPRSRQSQRLVSAKRDSGDSTSRNSRKRAKLEPREEDEKDPGNIVNWPEALLKKLVSYLELEDVVKLRCTSKILRDVIDDRDKINTFEIDVRRLDETEIGLFVAENHEESRFVIATNNFTYTEHLLRPYRQIRRGMVTWTRHHRNRMGRIRTALKSMLARSHIYKINISQVNMSNSFLRDIRRVLDGHEIAALKVECQMWEAERPDLSLLGKLPCANISLAIRLKEREPIPTIDKFLDVARHNYSLVVVEVRQDSWKFQSSMHYRKSYTDCGITGSDILKAMQGRRIKFLRLKMICRHVTKESLLHTIKYIHDHSTGQHPSRGFCVVVSEAATVGLIDALKQFVPPFIIGDDIKHDDATISQNCYDSSFEHLQLIPISQDTDKPKITEVRYWRKGKDDRVPHYTRRVADNGNFDQFELPRWIKRIS